MTTYETPATSPGSGADAAGPVGDEGFWFLGGQVRVLHRGVAGPPPALGAEIS